MLEKHYGSARGLSPTGVTHVCLQYRQIRESA
jgi:hypothetical protein